MFTPSRVESYTVSKGKIDSGSEYAAQIFEGKAEIENVKFPLFVTVTIQEETNGYSGSGKENRGWGIEVRCFNASEIEVHNDGVDTYDPKGRRNHCIAKASIKLERREPSTYVQSSQDSFKAWLSDGEVDETCYGRLLSTIPNSKIAEIPFVLSNGFDANENAAYLFEQINMIIQGLKPEITESVDIFEQLVRLVQGKDFKDALNRMILSTILDLDPEAHVDAVTVTRKSLATK